MVKARTLGVNTPYLLFIDIPGRKIYMQDIENAIKLRDFFDFAIKTKSVKKESKSRVFYS